MKKAQLGAIVKGMKMLSKETKAVKAGAKAGVNAYKKSKLAVAKKAAKTAKTYGESGQYARLEDMKKSEFYRDRHNASSTPTSSASKAKAAGYAATAGALAGAAYAKNKSKTKKK
jgi:hypothetical protein